ncbi:MAG: rhodanese-like domain-containing protein [Gammaproteobacteria bacterium]
MAQYIEFATNHWILTAALLVIIYLLLLSFFGQRLRGYLSASPSEATMMINREDAVVLDVRETNEYQSGHIVNSVHIPLAYLKERLGELDKHKGKPVIVACRSGHRSGQACSVLKKNGYENVYNLRGGVMAWEGANLPLQK